MIYLNRLSPNQEAQRSPHPTNRRGAFTLVELLVVISIAAVVSGLTLGGYRSVSDGNQRVSCQTNLTQIYQALQLYSKDYDGFYPRYDKTDNTVASPDGVRGIGLWALYGTIHHVPPANTTISLNDVSDVGEQFPGTGLDKPLGMYLRNSKQLHCPADAEHEDFRIPVDSNTINQEFLSYQTIDPETNEYTYQPWRSITNDADWRARRQLLRYRQPTPPGSLGFRRMPISEDAVITYCIWHRGARPVDNVLFHSGAVRPVPQLQQNPTPIADRATGEPATLKGWLRKPSF